MLLHSFSVKNRIATQNAHVRIYRNIAAIAAIAAIATHSSDTAAERNGGTLKMFRSPEKRFDRKEKKRLRNLHIIEVDVHQVFYKIFGSRNGTEPTMKE